MLVFPRVAADGLDLPHARQTEAGYMKHIFLKTLYDHFAQTKDLSPLCRLTSFETSGTNTGAKIANARGHFNDAAAIQAVTLAYSQRRVHGTLRKQLGDAPVISVAAAYPLGITRESWPDWSLAYATVLDEADKTGPCAGTPAYAQFFDPINVAAETQRVNAYNAADPAFRR